MRLPLALLTLVAALVTGCATPPPAPPAASGPVKVKILAINDFHGNLKPPLGGIRVKDPANPGKTMSVDAGGAEYLATVVAELRAKNPNPSSSPPATSSAPARCCRPSSTTSPPSRPWA